MTSEHRVTTVISYCRLCFHIVLYCGILTQIGEGGKEGGGAGERDGRDEIEGRSSSYVSRLSMSPGQLLPELAIVPITNTLHFLPMRL